MKFTQTPIADAVLIDPDVLGDARGFFIGANAGPGTPGTAYILFHHVMGECNGVRGVWGYVQGGMGGLATSWAGNTPSVG